MTLRSRLSLSFVVVALVPVLVGALLVAQGDALLGGVLLAVLLVAGLLGWQLARATTRPIAELSEAAARVAAGDLDTRIDVRSRDEVGRLAASFNDMTEALRTYIGVLESSRDELRQELARLGETLSSTHDLARMLEVILDTAMAATHARAGAILLTAAGRDELHLRVGRGLEERGASPSLRVRLGAGVSGHVAASGVPMRGRTRALDVVPAPEEPRAESLISVPLRSGGKVIGVLNLYDRADADDFDEGDLDTIRTFAGQAGVAIDNVLLHQEAQRLSLTDGLTGLWNYRYLWMTLTREIERSSRFERPVSVLMLDLDHFKSVNDVYGHERGDAVLVELATRVRSAIREVDMFARYGGEEFVLMLPETDAPGAARAAERVCRLVRETPFGSESEAPLQVSVSIGAAVFPAHGASAVALLRSADHALYAAKSRGRDRWEVATGAAAPASAHDRPPSQRRRGDA